MPWTVRLYLTYRSALTHKSIWRLRNALVAETKGRVSPGETVSLRLRRSGTPFELRLLTYDRYTFGEVFLERVYAAVAAVGSVRTIVDIGANAGFASLYFLDSSPSARVFAVEPDPRNIPVLTRNLSPVGGRVFQGALWHSDQPVHFALPERPADMVTGGVAESQGERSVMVRGCTAQTILDESGFGEVDILKVDVEGAERHLLHGNLAWLHRVRCVLVEFHEDARRASQFDRVMQEHGFSVHDNGHTVAAFRQA